ncbi:MAG: hypothetical protein LWX54_05190 [Deltaproteobacteria bacterium]|jgi:hypothetical protein|nr:hypothetical protein [Deltaproteobacteria bacterium]
MKSLIKKIGVFVIALAFMVSTASVVLAHGTGNEPGPGWESPAPWSGPDGN